MVLIQIANLSNLNKKKLITFDSSKIGPSTLLTEKDASLARNQNQSQTNTIIILSSSCSKYLNLPVLNQYHKHLFHPHHLAPSILTYQPSSCRSCRWEIFHPDPLSSRIHLVLVPLGHHSSTWQTRKMVKCSFWVPSPSQSSSRYLSSLPSQIPNCHFTPHPLLPFPILEHLQLQVLCGAHLTWPPFVTTLGPVISTMSGRIITWNGRLKNN